MVGKDTTKGKVAGGAKPAKSSIYGILIPLCITVGSILIAVLWDVGVGASIFIVAGAIYYRLSKG